MHNEKQSSLTKQRNTYATNLMLMLAWSVPFIPFIPIAMRLGFWRVDEFTYDTSSVGKVLDDILVTMLIGFVTYAAVAGFFVWLFFF